MAGTWRAIGRFTRMLRHTLQGLRLARNGFHDLDAASQQRTVERWARGFLTEAGVALQVQGSPVAQGPVLLVANHQSWLDIPTLHAARHCRFVSKAEIARWPLVGALAQAAGTLFVQRSVRRDTQRTVQAMVEALRHGDDRLDAAFARLLLWTEAPPLPAVGDVEGGFRYYLSAWRPGAWARGSAAQRAELRRKWGLGYARAMDTVNEENPAGAGFYSDAAGG